MCLCEFDKKLRSSLDINELCSECTSKNAKKNNSLVDGAVDNAGSCLRTGLFDFVLLNPPYVVTTSEELHKSQKEQDLSASWSGGNNGTELLFDSLLPKALKLLNKELEEQVIAIFFYHKITLQNKGRRRRSRKRRIRSTCCLLPWLDGHARISGVWLRN